MSFFGENLQFYRKRENITQEQLAEQLDVSRQTISKWEAGTSYAEMEKILQLCDIFSCDMDTLLRKNASEYAVEDDAVHRAHMKRFRNGITAGCVTLILGFAMYEVLSGLGMLEVVCNTAFMLFVIVAVLIFVVIGMQNDDYRKRHAAITDFYTESEKEEYGRKFPVRMAVGIGMILIGMMIFGMNGENLPLRKGMSEDFYYGIFLCFVAAGSGILVHSGMRKDEYDVKKYNKDSRQDKNSRLISIWSGCIMLVATMIFLVAGIVFTAWKICWLVYPVGGLMCGIVSLIISKDSPYGPSADS